MQELTADERDVVECNLGLAGAYATKVKRPHEDWGDLYHVAIFGLSKAVQKCDAEKGALSTYAEKWMRQAIQRHRANTDRPIRVPVYLQAEDAKDKFNPECVAAMEQAGRVGPLVFDDGDSADPVDHRAVDALGSMIDREAIDALRHAIGRKLPYLKRKVVQGRLAGKPYREVGESLGISGEYVRRIEMQAMTKLHECLAEYA